MAQGISDELTKSYRFPNMAHLHLKVRLVPLDHQRRLSETLN